MSDENVKVELFLSGQKVFTNHKYGDQFRVVRYRTSSGAENITLFCKASPNAQGWQSMTFDRVDFEVVVRDIAALMEQASFASILL